MLQYNDNLYSFSLPLQLLDFIVTTVYYMLQYNDTNENSSNIHSKNTSINDVFLTDDAIIKLWSISRKTRNRLKHTENGNGNILPDIFPRDKAPLPQPETWMLPEIQVTKLATKKQIKKRVDFFRKHGLHTLIGSFVWIPLCNLNGNNTRYAGGTRVLLSNEFFFARGQVIEADVQTRGIKIRWFNTPPATFTLAQVFRSATLIKHSQIYINERHWTRMIIG